MAQGNVGENDLDAPLDGVIGNSDAMKAVYRLTRQASQSDASVLLLGETGVGKEVIAHSLHQLSERRTGPMITVNCGALSENLLESELFGHVKGAFTGAIANRTGRFEAAHNGTIFLDEINSTSLHLQIKLLRVLQEMKFERVGSTESVTVDVRVIAASNQDLLDAVDDGNFREDLYWRLNVLPIQIPPLRQRKEDIALLAAHYLKQYSRLYNRHVVHISDQTIDAMNKYHWPGNVRELQNYAERAVVSAGGDEFEYHLLPDVIRGVRRRKISSVRAADLDGLVEELIQHGVENSSKGENLFYDIVSRIEKELISQIMTECDNVQIKAAKRLGINRNTLHKKLKDYGLDETD
jgi:transcriptional regulator with PAS, ATPase and Fis domain